MRKDIAVKEKKTTLSWTLIFAMAALAFSMRAAMSSVGPLISLMKSDLQLSSTIAGFLTTIPLITFALTSPFAAQWGTKTDLRVLLVACTLVNAIGVAVRSLCGVAGLFIGTILIGLATGTLNVIIPAWVRCQFSEHIGFMMGLYSTVMTLASAISAGIVQPIARATGSWRVSLGSSLVTFVIALLTCILAWKNMQPRLPQPVGTNGRLKIRPRYMAIAFFMGLQSFLFFSCLSWLPSIVGILCPGMTQTGILITVMQCASLIPAVVMPIVLGKTQKHGVLASSMALLLGLGFLILLLSNGSVALVMLGTILAGIGSGGTLSVALTLVAMQGSNAGETAKISGFCQCIGYLLAAFGPTGFGYLIDAVGSWVPILWIMVVLSCVMMLIGWRAGKKE